MAELPGPVARLDQYLATTTLAHEVIWRLRRSLIALQRDDDLARLLLGEAAALVVDELPGLLREARRLRALWASRSFSTRRREQDRQGARRAIGARRVGRDDATH